MTLVELRATISQQQQTPALPPLLDALWWEAKGDWNRAHEIAQVENGADGRFCPSCGFDKLTAASGNAPSQSAYTGLDSRPV
jgi:hypothetical protein